MGEEDRRVEGRKEKREGGEREEGKGKKREELRKEKEKPKKNFKLLSSLEIGKCRKIERLNPVVY